MPLQRRTFVQTRSSTTNPTKVAVTNERKKLVEKRSVERTLPPESLRTRNDDMLRSERLRVVMRFLDEDDSAKDDSAILGVNGDGNDGISGTPKNRQSVQDNSLLDAKFSHHRRSHARGSVGISGVDSTSHVNNGPLSPASGGLSVMSPPSSPPRHASALDSPLRVYGRQHIKSRSRAVWRQSQTQHKSEEEMQSLERSRRIMAALCKHAYQGIKQVERRVFYGDERLLAQASSSPHAGRMSASIASSGLVRQVSEAESGEELQEVAPGIRAEGDID
mmetsp:Transcript_87926/g.138806  ORF Transcript_87926/g.138806 Transcript_87926/m.138806 type:complete len:277 (+) Transcript_87926:33-863(+)